MTAPRAALGNRLAPPRFVLFVAVLLAVTLGLRLSFGTGWGDALVTGFDLAALIFIAALWPIMRDRSAQQMRRHASKNDAGRGLVLVLTVLVVLALLAAITAELPQAKAGDPLAIAKLVGTLALSWIYANLIFMLHYAHMHYRRASGGKADEGGFDFPGTPEPDYWDFLYFSFTTGMSFAVSDVVVTRGAVRRIVVLHAVLSFVFNIGVLAFSINVLAGAAGN